MFGGSYQRTTLEKLQNMGYQVKPGYRLRVANLKTYLKFDVLIGSAGIIFSSSRDVPPGHLDIVSPEYDSIALHPQSLVKFWKSRTPTYMHISNLSTFSSKFHSLFLKLSNLYLCFFYPSLTPGYKHIA